MFFEASRISAPVNSPVPSIPESLTAAFFQTERDRFFRRKNWVTYYLNLFSEVDLVGWAIPKDF
jgi:hypothetical protein